MRLKSALSIVGPIAAAIVAVVTVQAAEPRTPPPPIGAIGDEDLSKLGDVELVERAEAIVKRMEEQLTDSFWLLEASLTAGDVSGAMARNEAITVMKGLVKLSEQNLINLKQKAAEGDRRRVENEYVKIAIAGAKVAEYYAQVKSAVSLGSGALELSNVERRLVYSGSLPVIDDLPTSFVNDYNVFFEPVEEPVHTSPYF
ncbi:MAG: hypothetical protein IT385_02565 [Deltaproteobacteria bacterium]|nr:hypothetical protein [Deltaproteobacteria bacterium]